MTLEAIHITPGAHPDRLEAIDTLPASGFLWVDVIRDGESEWPELIARLTGVRIHERHLLDSRNAAHPSFYDGTSDYDMLIFRGLAGREGDQFATRPTAFFLFDRILVTVRPSDCRPTDLIRKRLLEGNGRLPDRPVALLHLLLNASVDGFLALREPLAADLERWRDELLDPNNAKDWRAVMGLRSQLLRLGLLCEEQEDAVTAWRDDTTIDIGENLMVRFNDLLEHIRRVTKFATAQQREVESLVQLHFSAVAHRTNQVVKVLTVISAIFLPLTLIAGIFGMNFENMPELRTEYGYFVALIGMALLGLGLLALFRFKRWV